MPLPRLPRFGAHADLLRDAMVYTAAGTLVRSVSLLVVPVLTRRLSIELFGILETITALQFGIATFASLNLDTALVRYFHEADTPFDRRTLVSTIFWATIAACVAGALGVVVMASDISRWLFQSPSYSRSVSMSAAGVPFMVLGTLALTVLRLERRTVEFGVLSFIAVIVQAISVSAAAMAFPNNVQAVVAAQLGGQAVFAILTTARIRPLLGTAVSRPVLRRAFEFSLPYFPSVVIAWYMSLANRFFLVSLSTLTAAATFAAASKVQALVLALAQAFWNAWKPHAMSRMREKDSAREMIQVSSGVVVVLAGAVAGVAIGAKAFLAVYAGPSYVAAAMPAAMLALGTCLNFGIAGFFGLRLEMVGKTGYLSLAQMATFVAATGLNVWLIPGMGADGAALAVVGSSVVQVLVLRAFSQRVDDARLPGWVWLPPAVAGVTIIVAPAVGLL